MPKKKYIYLLQTCDNYPYFRDLVTDESDCIILYWREPPPQPIQIFNVSHLEWNGEIHFFEDGHMERPGIDKGKYYWEPKKKINLYWDRWASEFLFYDRKKHGYFSEDRSFNIKERKEPIATPWKEIRMFNSTWNTGRNRLLKEAFLMGEYDYYIFMDDDLVFSDSNKTKESPFRIFEKFLLESKPAVGITNGSWHQEIFCPENELCSPHYYDACFNAFRKDTLEILLPYCENYDDISWWWSHAILYTVGGLLYEGGHIQNNRINYKNLVHLDYPKSKINKLSIPIEWVGSSFMSLSKNIPIAPHVEKFMYNVIENIPALHKKDLEKIVSLKHPYWFEKKKFWEGLKGSWL